MKKRNLPIAEIAILAVGELIVSLLVVGGYLLCDLIFEAELFDFSYRVITGVLLGSCVTVLNYLFLCISVNRAVNRFLALRGDAEMDEEEAAKFALENSMPIQNAIKTSFIIRTVSMLAAFIVAFVVDWFAPLATVIPLLMFRPIITVGGLIRQKFNKTPEIFLGDSEYTEINENPDEEKESEA